MKPIGVLFKEIMKYKKHPISRRVIRMGAIKIVFLRDQIAGSNPICVEGIIKRPTRIVKKVLSSSGIDVANT